MRKKLKYLLINFLARIVNNEYAKQLHSGKHNLTSEVAVTKDGYVLSKGTIISPRMLRGLGSVRFNWIRVSLHHAISVYPPYGDEVILPIDSMVSMQILYLLGSNDHEDIRKALTLIVPKERLARVLDFLDIQILHKTQGKVVPISYRS